MAKKIDKSYTYNWKGHKNADGSKTTVKPTKFIQTIFDGENYLDLWEVEIINGENKGNKIQTFNTWLCLTPESKEKASYNPYSRVRMGGRIK